MIFISRRRRFWVAVALGAIAAFAAVVQAVDAVALLSGYQPLETCAKQMTLNAVEIPGMPWQEHRHWFELETPWVRRGPYYIRDDDTGALYRWPFTGNINGKARFMVQTRWTWFNQDWRSHRWTLFYDCAG